MRTLQQLKTVLKETPNDFEALYELSKVFNDDKQFAASFAMSDRAITSYEGAPVPNMQAQFFEIKRLHAQLQKERLDDILGPAIHLIDPHWVPVYKNGRPREMSWTIAATNLTSIIPALSSPQLRKLRFLNITVNDRPNETLQALAASEFTPIRSLSLQFKVQPDTLAITRFLAARTAELQHITALNVAMPRIDNDIATKIRNAFGALESFSLTSLDRTGITHEFCDLLADDHRSCALLRLALIGTSIGNEGLFSIIESKNFTALQALDLHDGTLNNGAAKILAATDNLPALRNVDLRFNQIDPAGIDMLRKCALKCTCDNQHKRPA
ncbi:MAG: hypothetical protein IKY83_14425 [Proteobacteria bacterium]|nr:hypothetical protein [Pseudomonadota bacterium]